MLSPREKVEVIGSWGFRLCSFNFIFMILAIIFGVLFLLSRAFIGHSIGEPSYTLDFNKNKQKFNL